MTFSDLALRSGISARTLAEIEYGMRALDETSRVLLAAIFDLEPLLLAGSPPQSRPAPRHPPQQLAALGLATVASALALSPMLQGQPEAGGAIIQQVMAALSSAQSAQPGQGADAFAAQPSATPTVAPSATPTPTPVEIAPTIPPTATPAPTAAPAFSLQADGPHGCPLIAPAGMSVVITQPFGVGTHVPAETMGAVDLAIDSDNNGYDNSDATFGSPVVTTLGGTAQVFPNSWPGGNFIIITNAESGYATAYGHLNTLEIADGQVVSAGQRLGTAGTTGYATGPHLHYEVRSPAGVNIDPEPLVGCAR